MWKENKRNLKETTYGNYVYMYEHFIEPEFGKRKIREIRKTDIRKLYNGMLDAKKLKVNTLDNIHTVLHQVFDTAVDDLYIPKNHNEAEIDNADREHRDPILLPDFSCHNLRHTFCTRYCENETNLKVIQEIMGHKDIATTMEIYAEATKDAKVKSFESLAGKIRIS